RPFDKFGEVINKGGFELKFRRRGLLRPGGWATEEGREQKQQMANGRWQMAKVFSTRPWGYSKKWGINGPPLPSPLLQRRRGRRYSGLGQRIRPVAAPGAKKFKRRVQGELC